MNNFMIKENSDILKLRFKKRVYRWAKRIGAKPEKIVFQYMRNKWASCSRKGQITFNVKLFEMPSNFQRAVIVHELLHILIPNHGKLFKSMFVSFVPDYKKILKS